LLLTARNQPHNTTIKLQMFADSPIRLCGHVGFIDPGLEGNLSLESIKAQIGDLADQIRRINDIGHDLRS